MSRRRRRVAAELPYNLVCDAGHVYWSPQPALWVGRQCSHTHGPSQPRARACQQTLRQLDATGRGDVLGEASTAPAC